VALFLITTSKSTILKAMILCVIEKTLIYK